jgi:hypothetical protein
MKTKRKILFSVALILAASVLCMPILSLPAKAQSTSAQTLILSNEYPGNTFIILQNEGYSSYTILQLLQKIVTDSNPSLGNVVPSSFIQALQNAPASSEVLTKTLHDYADYNAMAISTDGTVQTVAYEGSSSLNTQGTLSLDTQVSGIDHTFRAVYASTDSPLTTFTPNNVTYNVFAILYMPSREISSVTTTPTNAIGTTHPTPSAPEFPVIAIIPLAAIALSALIITKKKKLIH